MYTPERLKQYREEMKYPNCDAVCKNVIIMNPRTARAVRMDDLINGIMKVYENRDLLKTI